ncbi:hypothetical protein [Tabrizicola sp.]|jgi:hypothetical protein|uniref:hypothetical protein n=1 Tax=Tabrizicola sp. TaxID=2005166 RepID=UPI001A4049AC|nr:hypothetical protein [Tabrizicola sp.]MBL9062978.1 hypothetical protein [Tabrizicola sp.]
MKIVEKTPAKLRLSASPWLMAILFLAITVTMLAAALDKQRHGASNEAGVLFLVGLAVLIGGLVFCAFVRLTLDRTTGRLTYSRFTLRGWQHRDWALADLAAIRAATDPAEKIAEGRPYRRLELVWKTGEPPFPLQTAYQRPSRAASGSKSPLETLASSVNSWLNGKR